MSQNPNHRYCSVCGKLYVSDEYAEQCHGVPGTRENPNPVTAKTAVPQPFIPKVRIDPEPRWKTINEIPKPKPTIRSQSDPNCRSCKIARQFGEILYCECMTK